MDQDPAPTSRGTPGTLGTLNRIRREVADGMDPRELVPRFQKAVWGFYRVNSREMPWRNDPCPYNVLVSEVMLQQTQVPRVRVKFPEFISRFPDTDALARAPFAEVLSAWKGLGYNRRARGLHSTAQIVSERFDGVLPSDPALLETFPQIGHATACSIAAFAFNAPVVFIETNIRRVFLFSFFPGVPEVKDRELLSLVRAALDHETPRHWYYALMDLGTAIGRTCTNPNRMSAHYARQTPFLGSDRKIRGCVLSHILSSGETDADELAAVAGVAPERMHRVLASLVKDNLVEVSNERVRLGT